MTVDELRRLLIAPEIIVLDLTVATLAALERALLLEHPLLHAPPSADDPLVRRRARSVLHRAARLRRALRAYRASSTPSSDKPTTTTRRSETSTPNLLDLGTLGLRGDAQSKVRTWFRTGGVGGLLRPRSGRKDHAVPTETVERIVQLAMSPPPAGRSRWTARLLAKEVRLSPGCVSDVLRRNGLKPHLMRTYKVSRDPDFASKVKDGVDPIFRTPAGATMLPEFGRWASERSTRKSSSATPFA